MTSDHGQSALLSARLRPPTTPHHYVRRGRLLAHLDMIVTSPVTLVVAPAGAGKTSLVGGWASESASELAWLSLEREDRDPVHFWTDLVAALAPHVPGCGDRALRRLKRQGQVLEAVADLVDDLDTEQRGPLVLIVDDVHLIDGVDLASDSLALFVQHLPDWLHLILAGRRAPRLPIDRLRVQGKVNEIGFAELEFSESEATELLARLAPWLASEHIASTAAHNAGWAAGLQLAALAARRWVAIAPEAPSAPDAERLVDDYLWHDVLATEPPHLVGALLDIAVVERVDASLASALIGRDDAPEILREAEDRGLFLSHRGHAGTWEVHALVRDALANELRRRSVSRFREQHTRAAQWFEANGEVVAALDHWVRAERPADALRLLATKHTELYDAGREATIRSTLAAIPAESVTDVASMSAFALCHLLVNRKTFTSMVDELASHTAEVDDPRTRGRIAVMRAQVSMLRGDLGAATTHARHALELFGESWRADSAGRLAWDLIARDIARDERWVDASAEVREIDLALVRDADRRTALAGTRALAHALAGRPTQALRVATETRSGAAVASLSILRAELELAEALARRESEGSARALADLVALADERVEVIAHPQNLAAAELVEAFLDLDDVESARDAFARAEALANDDASGAGFTRRLGRAGAALALARGDLEGADRWSREIVDGFWGPLTDARIMMARGDLSATRDILGAVSPRSPRHEVVHGLLKAQSAANRDDAARHATLAVEVAVAHGMVQTIASTGRDTVELVERAAWRVPDAWLDRVRRTASGGGTATLALTPRELMVVRLLPSRLTVREIASELYISQNTLKFHLKVIYRKLGVTSRAEAVTASQSRAT